MAQRQIRQGIGFKRNSKFDFKSEGPNIPEDIVEKIKSNGLNKEEFSQAIYWIEDAHLENSTNTTEIAERRFRAFSRFPGLINHLVTRDETEAEKDFKNKIDGAEKFYKAAEQYFTDAGFPDIKERHLKRLRGVEKIRDNSFSIINAAAIAMDINLFPDSDHQLDTLSSVFNGLHNDYPALSNDRSYQYRKHLSESNSYGLPLDKFLFDQFETGLRSFQRSDYAVLTKEFEEQSFQNFRDIDAWIKNNITSPLYLNSLNTEELREYEEDGSLIPNYAFARQLMGDLPFRDLARMNADIHRNLAKINEAMSLYDRAKDRDMVKEWQAKYPPANNNDLPELGEFSIVPLTTRAQLQEEHEAMDHCIDNYAPNCIRGYSHVFSLRDTTGKTLSNFELDTDGNLIQNLGYKNAQPTEEISIAVNNYVQAVNEEKLKPNKNYNDWRNAVDEECIYTTEQIDGYLKTDIERATLAFKTLLDLGVLPPSISKFGTARAWAESIKNPPKPSSIMENNM